MVKKLHHSFLSTLLLIFTIMLTGCPGIGDRLREDEEAKVSLVNDKVCFGVPNAEDYQPVNIAINRRGISYEEKSIIFKPDLKIVEGVLCIPPSFYRFPDSGQFIVGYVLTSKKHSDKPRRIVAGLEISNGRIYNIPLTDMEITRPYSETKKQ